jgi:hypothetical protein
MGNLKSTTKPRPKSVPKQILPSGEGINAVEIQDKQTGFLLIQLVKLNLVVVKQTSVSDEVEVIWRGDTFYCFWKSEILGKVPSSYNSKLKPSNVYRAHIDEIKLDPIMVSIKLYL